MTQGSGNDEDQLREIREAQQACEAALSSLAEAQRSVGSARSWGTTDTWFGGGLFSSMVKHNRIDEAEGYMRAVDAALDRLRHELADAWTRSVRRSWRSGERCTTATWTS